MKRHHPSSLRPILVLLALVIGPLHAQTTFACAMMGGMILDECCCDVPPALEDQLKSDCGADLDAIVDPCCEQSVEVRVDQETKHDKPIVKPFQLPSSVDPPPAIVDSFGALIEPLSNVASSVNPFSAIAAQSGSDTYLITQRLRI